jgi:hypothetical protein
MPIANPLNAQTRRLITATGAPKNAVTKPDFDRDLIEGGYS